MSAVELARPGRDVGDLSAPDPAGATPYRVFRERTARARLAQVAGLRDELSTPELALTAGYSVKTNPRPEMMVAARESGFFAEVISPQEFAWAQAHAFGAERTIYNGPQPLGRHPSAGAIGFTFADSIEAWRRNVGERIGTVRGIRLRPSMITSRFGVARDDETALTAAAAALEHGAPIAISFHARREDFKGAGWRDVAADVLDRAQALEVASGRPVVAFDVGGGWTPEEFDADFAADMRWLRRRIGAQLPRCTQLIFEAGQAVCTPSEALVTTVLELRSHGGHRDAVIDAGYPDWPLMHTYPHRIYAWIDQAWQPLARGDDRLLGRTCLEYDQLDGLRFPATLSEGDCLAIVDAGSYDSSMAFDFGRGGRA